MSLASREAVADARAFYDERYRHGYMQDFDHLFEACRAITVRETLARLDAEPARVLDYGCGEGRYVEVLRERFPRADVVGCDISDVAIERARRQHGGRYLQMADERVPTPDGTFDLVLSIEVIEHVADAELAIWELGRVLAPGGRVVLTTPCANPGSLEWLINRRRGDLQRTPDGYGRFATDEPGHLRRLTSRDARVLLARAGVEVEHVWFRSHALTTLLTRGPGRVLAERLPAGVRLRLAMVGWRLLRWLPNGSTMIVVGRRTT